MTGVLVRQQWDQLDEESDQQYRWFTVYRDLGPGRSLRKAQRKIREQEPVRGAKKSNAENVSGAVTELATKHQWFARAQAYDIENLKTHGHRVAITYVDALEKMARKVRRAIIRSDVTELEWKKILDTMQFIANQLNRASEAQSAPSVGGPVPAVRPALPEPGASAGDANGFAQ